MAYQPMQPLNPCGLGAIDVSTFTWQDWAAIGGVGLLVFTLGSSRPRRRRRSRKGGGFDLKTIGIVAALGVGGYLLYQASQSTALSAIFNPGISVGNLLTGSGTTGS